MLYRPYLYHALGSLHRRPVRKWDSSLLVMFTVDNENIFCRAHHTRLYRPLFLEHYFMFIYLYVGTVTPQKHSVIFKYKNKPSNWNNLGIISNRNVSVTADSSLCTMVRVHHV